MSEPWDGRTLLGHIQPTERVSGAPHPTDLASIRASLHRGAASLWRALYHTGVVEGAARVGYAARGAVYLSIGAVALLKALHQTPHAEGAIGALRAWSAWPPGVALLWIMGVGLCSFAVWRGLQSVFDVEGLGVGPKGLISRIGKAISGLLYGTLGVTVLNLLDTLRDLRMADEQAQTTATIAHTLTLPFGRSMVVGFGLVLLATGAGNIVRAFIDHFASDLKCHMRWRTPFGLAARMGYFARGAAFLPAGVFTILAGWRSQPHTAVAVGRALEYFQSLPSGDLILAVQGVGLMAFGVFGVVKAALRAVDLGGAESTCP